MLIEQVSKRSRNSPSGGNAETYLLEVLLGLFGVESRLDSLDDALSVDTEWPLMVLLPRRQGLQKFGLDL